MAAGAFRIAVQEGDNEKGCFLAGQCAAMVRTVQPAAEIVRSVMEEAEPILRGAARWVE
jgi:enoyl-[acyl-carrier protein] reductase II